MGPQLLLDLRLGLLNKAAYERASTHRINTPDTAVDHELLQKERDMRGKTLWGLQEVVHRIPRKDELRQQMITRRECELVVFANLAIRVKQTFQTIPRGIDELCSCKELHGIPERWRVRTRTSGHRLIESQVLETPQYDGDETT